MLSVFTLPAPAIAHETHGVLLACNYQGDLSREVVNIKEIASVVGMIPLPPRKEEATYPRAKELYAGRHFVAEKLGFDMSCIGQEDNMHTHDDGS